MHAIHFDYGDADPTIEAVVSQAIGYGSVCWTEIDQAGVFDSQAAVHAAVAAVDEIRLILHTQLTALLDQHGVARDWNDAIERALQVIDGEAPS